MEIERTEIRAELRSDSLRLGSLVRVKVISALGKGLFLVEFKGRTHYARLSENIRERFFIARVTRAKPPLELKFVKGLNNTDSFLNRSTLASLFRAQKSFIENLIASDNFHVYQAVVIQRDGRRLKESLKRSIKRQQVAQLVNTRSRVGGKVRDYYILQNILNYIDPDTFQFCFPLDFCSKYDICDVKYFSSKERAENGLFILIQFNEGHKIAFLIFVNYEACVCTVGTNNDDLDHLVKRSIGELRENLKEVYQNRDVRIHISSLDEEDFFRFSAIKKIDIKM